jgi:hypothetical protein
MTTADFQLLVECCRSAFTGGTPRRLDELGATVDWPRFLRAARFHRVQGLVWKCLSANDAGQPNDVASALAGDAEDIAASSLRSAVECRRLRQAFDDAGIALLFVKGLTVGTLAYANPALKAAIDIDLLVSRDELEKSAQLLLEQGYRLVIPQTTSAGDRLLLWHRRRKESVWGSDDALPIDLHTRLADQPRLIPAIDVRSPRQIVEVANGVELPTLARDELFAYLCVHGASSAWFRLKWITDLAAILHGLDASEIERGYLRSQELGAGRAAAQALLLADELYGSLRGSGLKETLRNDRASRWLAAIALRQLAGRAEPREPTETFLGTAWIHLSQLLLMPGPRFAFSEAVRQILAVTA